jgi:hypothetical protein
MKRREFLKSVRLPAPALAQLEEWFPLPTGP